MQQDSAELFYFGRSTVKIRTGGGFVVYIDPYAPGDYSEAADLVLVTHGHGDHNRVDLVPRRPGCLVASPLGAVAEGGARPVAEGESFTAGPVRVSVLPAANRNHDRASCVGYLLFFDGIVLYHAGDTDYLPEMEGWASLHIGYALLPCDGFYNMGPEGASRCAAAMKARRVIPIHSSKDGSYDAQNARAVRATEVIILIPGGKVALKA
jgi:L-ascorbate metabolism protein UlaG (beta-lactamase superfamily)